MLPVLYHYEEEIAYGITLDWRTGNRGKAGRIPLYSLYLLTIVTAKRRLVESLQYLPTRT